MKSILTLSLIAVSITAIAQTRHYKHIDTLTIYKSGNRRIVIGGNVTYLKAKYELVADTVNVCNYFKSNKNSLSVKNKAI